MSAALSSSPRASVLLPGDQLYCTVDTACVLECSHSPCQQCSLHYSMDPQLQACKSDQCSGMQAEEEGTAEVADTRDGWDVDSDFEAPDAQDLAATTAAPPGDQGWVGFGPSPDASSASQVAPGLKAAGQPLNADSMPHHHSRSHSQQSIKYPNLRLGKVSPLFTLSYCFQQQYSLSLSHSLF